MDQALAKMGCQVGDLRVNRPMRSLALLLAKLIGLKDSATLLAQSSRIRADRLREVDLADVPPGVVERVREGDAQLRERSVRIAGVVPI